jgi:NADPH:quinone reductase-like Zn-dependent oxidoreductase
MKAAVVHAFDQPPRYRDFDEPVPRADEVIVRVRAAALSQLVRSQAAGKHYSSQGALPFVPGADGVGEIEGGARVYFAFPRAPVGSMAEKTAVKRAYCVPLPDGLDDVTAAAVANPGMSSWAALTERAGFVRGESVLINGATGVSGRLAIQIARHLGARRVVATGRTAASEEGLRALGADAFVPLDQPPARLTAALAQELAGVDVVLDYLWGPSAECLLAAAAGHGEGEAARRLRFVQIGSLGGGAITLPAGALRSSGLELLGSGLGSVSHEGLLRAIGGLMQAVVPAKFAIQADAIPLTEVERAWAGEASGRVVFTA